MAIKKTHFVFVEWEDHSSTPGKGLSADDIHDVLIVHSAGMFVAETRTVLKLATDQKPHDTDDNDDGMTILKKNIVERVDVIKRKKD